MDNKTKTVKNFIEGVNNMAFKKEHIETMFKERLQICKNCPIFTEFKDRIGFARMECDDTKGGCGCYIDVKLRIPEEKCPHNKWNSKV